jgi:5-methylcytosine-specific restriction protein A
MPTKPKRPCSHPGCPKLTAGRFCEEHAKDEARRYERYQRDPATRKRYGQTWRKVRDYYRATHPLCEQCLEQGRATPAQEVHHVKPLSQGGTNDYENLRALCCSCHSSITAHEGGRWQKRLE